MKIPEVKKQALGALKGKWGLAVLATFVFFLIYIVVPMIIEIPFGGFDDPTPIAANLVNLIVTILLFPFSFAFYWFFLSLARLDTPKISDLFTVYADVKNSLKLIGATILVSIFVFSLVFIISYSWNYKRFCLFSILFRAKKIIRSFRLRRLSRKAEN